MGRDERMRCANCTVSLLRLRRHTLSDSENNEILSLLRQWHHHRSIDTADHICHRCWSLISTALHRREDLQSPIFGHQNVCVNCGRSLLKARCHTLTQTTVRERRIYNVVAEWILPNEVQRNSQICHPCWMRADQYLCSAPSTLQSMASTIKQEVVDDEDGVLSPQPDLEIPRPDISTAHDTITLPNYLQASSTENRCIFLNCQDQHRFVVPISVRKHLLVRFNFYVPPNCRICREHLIGDWESVLTTGIQLFTAKQIEDMFSILKLTNTFLDFNNLEKMPDHLVYYWIGFLREQFTEIMLQVPQLSKLKRGNIGLAAYLIKLRTGDSDERISSLLNIPRRTLEDLLKKVHNILQYQNTVSQMTGVVNK